MPGPTGGNDADSQAIIAKVARVMARVQLAADRAGRATSDIQVMLAAKQQPVSSVATAVAAIGPYLPAGSSVLVGENRVQELVGIATDLTELVESEAIELHQIGPLQTNKVNQLLRNPSVCLESLDSLKLAAVLNEKCGLIDRTLEVMLQVNVSGESSKSGCPPEAAIPLAAEIAGLPNLRLTGFMCLGLPPVFGWENEIVNREEIRSGYRLLREIRDAVVESPETAAATELSMGMSADLELAIAEGATIVRVGTAVFGRR